MGGVEYRPSVNRVSQPWCSLIARAKEHVEKELYDE
jgi:hypothetical protein